MPRNTMPGPGTYTLPPVVGYRSHDLTKTRLPSYTMGYRVSPPKGQATPGPIYDVSCVTRYGPGPGAYALPPLVGYHFHDQTKTRQPMYTMGTRRPVPQPMLTPGPQYDISKVTRNGKITLNSHR
ncbi:hypothetical protein FQR65_LT05870 [Abscondita terminalis]|nr:hypothetical protein FQR65_LT05870 [Abscondita terminalis]